MSYGPAVAVAVAVMLAATGPHADPAAKPQARLYYQKTGDSACPETEVIRAAVTDRLGYEPFADVAPTTILVAVSIDADRKRRALISVIDASGEEFGLRVPVSSAPDCSELAKTVALMIALAIPAAVESNRDAQQSAELAALARTAWTPLPTEPAPAPIRPRVERETTAWRVGLGGRASVGAVPGFAPGVALGLEARRGALSLGASVIGDFAQTVHVGDGQIHASLFRLALVGCRHGGGFGMCALVAGGASHAEGHGFSKDSSATTPYLAIGGRISYEIGLVGRWSVMVHVDAESAVYGAALRVDGAMSWTWTAPGAALGGGLVLRSGLW